MEDAITIHKSASFKGTALQRNVGIKYWRSAESAE